MERICKDVFETLADLVHVTCPSSRRGEVVRSESKSTLTQAALDRLRSTLWAHPFIDTTRLTYVPSVE